MMLLVKKRYIWQAILQDSLLSGGERGVVAKAHRLDVVFGIKTEIKEALLLLEIAVLHVKLYESSAVI